MADIKVLDVTPPGWGERLIASYLVIGSERSVLIETGPRGSYSKLREALQREGVKPDMVVVTHIHLDHAGAAGTIARDLGVPVIVHPRGLRHLADPSKLWRASRGVLGEIAEVYGEPEPVPYRLLLAAGEGTVIPLGGGEDLLIVHTPGHASHHMVALLRPEGLLFTGDAAGVSVELPEGRLRIPTTPPPFKADAYIESLQKMGSLNPSRVVPTHYGVDPMDGTEYISEHILQTRTWLREIEEIVRQGIDDVEEAARMLAERLPEARLAATSSNRIIYVTFYLSTVWGMLEYVKSKLKSREK